VSNKHFPGLLLLLDWFLEGGGGNASTSAAYRNYANAQATFSGSWK